jgi:ATP-binding cassette, subfamily B, bacterial
MFFIKNFPFYRQHSRADCGAACLRMVASYWGKAIDYQLLVDLASINRSGASLANLIDAAESLGFSASPGKSDLLGLSKNPLPAIAHWSGNHYVVVYKITSKIVVIADPKIGIKKLSRQDFCAHWTGYALWLEPTARFYQQENKQAELGKFINLLRPYKTVLLEILITSVVVNLLGLVLPIFTQVLLDRVVNYGASATFWAIGSGLLIARIVQSILLSLRRYLLFHTADKLDLTLIVGFVGHALKLPLSYFESRYVGDITSRIQENRKIRQFLTADTITTLLDVLNIFLFAGLMFWYSPKLTLLALVIVPILIVLTKLFTPLLMNLSRQVFSAGALEQSYLIEFLSGITTIKSMAVEQAVRWRWERLLNKYVNISFDNQMVQERLSLVASLSETIISTSVLLLGIWQVIHNQLTIGELIAFNMLAGQVISPFKRLNLLWHDFQEVRIAVERCEDVLSSQPEVGLVGKQLLALKSFHGSVVFDAVSFRYETSSEKNTIDNLSFEIKPGQTVAIVGRSGSGKTTISKLLLGLYQPQTGLILIDGQPISSIFLPSLRQKIGIVDQNTFLFGDTIKKNLLLTNPNATQSEIESACRLACAYDFIGFLPLGYDTKIGEGGGLLSGGQRQRIALARALLRNPSLLILDEATSNLDTESERIIQDNLRNILVNQTTLVIAHRLSTVRYADLILVMSSGRLVESGTHEQLIELKGIYYSLATGQLGVN